MNCKKLSEFSGQKVGPNTDSTGHSSLKSFELLKNGLLTFGKKIAWQTCMVGLKFIDVIFFINNHLLIFIIGLAWRTWPNSYTFSCNKNSQIAITNKFTVHP